MQTTPRSLIASSRRGGTAQTRSRRNAYLLLAPALIYLVALIVVPVGQGLWLSLTDTVLMNPRGGEFIGLDNYASILTSGRLWNSVWVTLLYTALTVVFALTVGIVAAFMINRTFRFRALARAVLTIPWAVPTIAVVLVFNWMFNQQSGIANRGLAALGIGEVGWLTDPRFGLVSVLIATVWKVFPFIMLVVLAALQSIPEELFEAARVDGASPASVLRTVTFPHIAPAVRLVALLMTVWSFRRFEVIYLLTGGGPADTTNTLVVSVYREAFRNQELGVAASVAMICFLLSIVVTIVYLVVERGQTRKEAST